MLNAERKFDKTVLRFDGVYTTYDTTRSPVNGQRYCDRYFLDNFFSFYKNGMVMRSALVFFEPYQAAKYLSNFMQYYNNEENGQLGVFSIINKDTIDIICYDRYRVDNGYINDFITHFKGIIKNADTIVNLKVVPPYPDVKPAHKLTRERNLKVINQPLMLVFKPFAAKKLVDSNNFWINKYKQ